MSTPARFSRRFDRFRFLRSDGKPSFPSGRYLGEGEAQRIASKPPVTVTKTTPLMEGLKLMDERKVRSLLVKEPGNRYYGMLLVEDVLSFLGGGDLYNAAVNRYSSNLNSVLHAPVSEICRAGYPPVSPTAKVSELVETMVRNGVDILPVVDEEGAPIGVVSVHDVLRNLAGAKLEARVRDAMTSLVPLVEFSSSLIEALRTMVNTGLRFALVRNELDQIVGHVSFREVVSYFARGRAHRYSFKGVLEEALSIRVGDLSSRDTPVIPGDAPLTEALRLLHTSDKGFAVVGGFENPEGVITELDIFLTIIGGKAV